MFQERIETERLHLERISADSVDQFDRYDLYSDGDDVEEMFEYWDSSPHETVKETASPLRFLRHDQGASGGFTFP